MQRGCRAAGEEVGKKKNKWRCYRESPPAMALMKREVVEGGEGICCVGYTIIFYVLDQPKGCK